MKKDAWPMRGATVCKPRRFGLKTSTPTSSRENYRAETSLYWAMSPELERLWFVTTEIDDDARQTH